MTGVQTCALPISEVRQRTPPALLDALALPRPERPLAVPETAEPADDVEHASTLTAPRAGSAEAGPSHVAEPAELVAEPVSLLGIGDAQALPGREREDSDLALVQVPVDVVRGLARGRVGDRKSVV